MKTVLFLGAGLCAGGLFAAVPTDLTADAVFRDRFTARWTNVGAVASNALEVVKVFPRELEADFVTNYTFDAFTNTHAQVNGQSDSVTNQLATAEPGFQGSMVYKAANSIGVLQIGSGSAEGCLEFAGLPSYDGLTLLLQAQRYVNKSVSAGNKMPIDWVVGDTTNTLKTITLGDQMKIYSLPIDTVEDGARLLFHSSTNKNDGRVLIDSIGFARDYTLPYSRTNAVASAVFPARGVHRVRGLEPQTRYLWRVGGWTADAAFLGFSAYAAVETTDAAAPAPFTILIR